MQDCQTTRNVIQSYRVEKTAIVSVLADLCVKHRRVASDDWSSLDVALFLVKKSPHSAVLQGDSRFGFRPDPDNRAEYRR